VVLVTNSPPVNLDILATTTVASALKTKNALKTPNAQTLHSTATSL
jgi:hypothetical protein